MNYINPIFQKELKQNARTKKTIVLMTGVTGFLLLFLLLSFCFIFERTRQQSVKSALSVYAVITILLFLVVLFLVPAIMAGSITREREQHTYDMMMCAKITPAVIIRGKLLSGMSLITLFLISALPIFGLMLFFGGITMYEILEYYGLLLLTSYFVASISLFYSSICKRTVTSTIFTYLTILFLTVILGALVLWKYLVAKEDMSSKRYLLLALNPIFTYLNLIERQIGTVLFPQIHPTIQNNFSYFMYSNFILYSAVLQSLLSVLFNQLSILMIKKKKHE